MAGSTATPAMDPAEATHVDPATATAEIGTMESVVEETMEMMAATDTAREVRTATRDTGGAAETTARVAEADGKVEMRGTRETPGTRKTPGTREIPLETTETPEFPTVPAQDTSEAANVAAETDPFIFIQTRLIQILSLHIPLSPQPCLP